MGQINQGFGRVQRAEGVRQMDKGHQPDPATVQQPLIFFQNQLAGIRERRHLQQRPSALAQHLPGHNVGMVLHGGDEDLVTGLDGAATEAAGHQIDAFGNVAGEDDFLSVGGVEKGPDLLARTLVGHRRTFRQQVHAAMDVGVVIAVAVADGVDHRLRFLHRGGIVQVHQRLAMHPLAQDRKIGADAGQIKGRSQRAGQCVRGAHSGQSPVRISRASRSASTLASRSRSGAS